jgi:hypothetical protein
VQPAWIIAMFQSLWGGQSELVLSFDGRIEARLGRADEDQLKEFPDAKPFSKERLEEQVAAAVREAMNAFLIGNVSEAERWLGQQPLQAIFVHASENRPRKHVRWTASVMAVIGLLNLVLWCYSFFDHPTPGPSLKPVNLSENEVRAALARESRTNRFTDEALPEGADLGLITWPPKSLFTPEIWQRLLDKQGLNLVPDLKFGPDFMTGRLMADQKIQHAFLSGMITKSDLA